MINRLLRLISVVLVVCLMVAGTSVSFAEGRTLPIMYSFDNYDIGKTVDELNPVGNIVITEQFARSEGDRCLFIKNDNDGSSASVSQYFDRISGSVICGDISILQKSVAVNGCVFFEFLSGADSIARIVSQDGDIVFVSGKSEALRICLSVYDRKTSAVDGVIAVIATDDNPYAAIKKAYEYACENMYIKSGMREKKKFRQYTKSLAGAVGMHFIKM